MDFSAIRRLTITALFADDKLLEQIVLKGGNALNLVYRLSPRTSLDLDFSLEKDFADLEDTKKRIFHTLKDRFDSAGYVVFDEKFQKKPKVEGPKSPPWWGGYELTFKLLPKDRHAALGGNLGKMQRSALVSGPHQERIFSVDFSKHEFTAGKEKREFDHYTIYVYPPTMIALEKLRALCQQMPEYEIKVGGRARARDFYDIHLVITKEDIDLTSSENLGLLRTIFEVKRVPLQLLAKIRDQREFHRPDWDDVRSSVGVPLQDFDFYFDFVVAQIDQLKSLWVE